MIFVKLLDKRPDLLHREGESGGWEWASLSFVLRLPKDGTLSLWPIEFNGKLQGPWCPHIYVALPSVWIILKGQTACEQDTQPVLDVVKPKAERVCHAFVSPWEVVKGWMSCCQGASETHRGTESSWDVSCPHRLFDLDWGTMSVM